MFLNYYLVALTPSALVWKVICEISSLFRVFITFVVSNGKLVFVWTRICWDKNFERGQKQKLMDQSLNNVTQPWYRIHSTLIDNDANLSTLSTIYQSLSFHSNHCWEMKFHASLFLHVIVLVCKNWRFHDAMTAKLWSFFLMLIALSILPRFLCGKFL